MLSNVRHICVRLALCAGLSLTCFVGAVAATKSVRSWADARDFINNYDCISFINNGVYNNRYIYYTIYVSHTVTLDLSGCVFTRKSGFDCSAIVVQNGGVLTLKNGSVDGYNVSCGNPLIVVENGGKLILQASLYDVILTGSQDGGAIRINAGGTVEMQSGYISGCYVPLGSGAAVFNNGGTFTMSGGTISDCSGGSTGAAGGAIRNYGTFNMTGGTITRCNCSTSSSTNGGAVFSNSSGKFNMSGGTISSCKAEYGGGVYNQGTFNMTGGTISSCGDNNGSYGGGVYNIGTFTMQGSAKISGCDINSAGGGGVYNHPNGTFNMNGSAVIESSYGYGVHNSGTFNMGGVSRVQNCTEGGVFSNGTTSIKGDAASCWIQGCSNFYGGGLCVQGGTTTVENCNIYKNTGDAGSQVACIGGTLNLKGANLDASVSSARGALFIQNIHGSPTVTMSGGDIKNSSATSDYGGAVTIYSGSFSMSGGWIANCSSAGSGGGIRLFSGSVTISDGKIYSNSATTGGGGIHSQGTLTLSGGEIYSNTATYGGGVRCTGGTTTLSGTEIYSNKASGNGNGVQLDAGSGSLVFNMTGGKIHDNTDSGSSANYGGGGILAWQHVTLNISGGEIYKNVTAGNGGAIHMGQTSSVTITGGKIYGNKSGGNSNYTGSGTPSGGIFYNSTGALTFGKTASVTGNFKSDGTTVSNVYIPAGNAISVGTGTDALATGASIGITTKTAPTTSKAVEFSGDSAAGDADYFSSDNSIYKVERNDSGKLELCGYRLTYVTNCDGASDGFVRTIKGQACPALPSLSNAGMYSPGWYVEDQAKETDAIPSADKQVTPGAAVDFSEDKTVYAWWKNIFYVDTTDPSGAKETISKETVTKDDVLYTLNQAEKNEAVKHIMVFDMSNSNGIENVEEVIDAIHNSSKSTTNTLIYLPEGMEAPADKPENVVTKKTVDDVTTYSCANFSITDGNPVKVPYSFTAEAATYNRANSSRWGTICVPFELKSNDRIQYYISGAIYNGALVLTKTATVEAGKPAIYCVSDLDVNGSAGSTQNKEDLSITQYEKNVLAESAGTSEQSGSAIKIGGSFTELVIDNSKAADFSGYDVYYYKDNKFYKRTSGQKVTITALRAYILIPASTNITPASAGPASISATSLSIREK